MARVGILGGSFNPVHSGHVRLASQARLRLGLDRVELMPAGEPPHKPGDCMLSFAHRMDLCRAAVQGEDGLEVNGLEGRRSGPSYTIETLELLVSQRPGDAFTFILGLGVFLQLSTWRRGLELVRHADLAVAARPGDLENSGHDAASLDAMVCRWWPRAAPLGHAAGHAWQVGPHLVRYLEGDFLVVSASEVRRRWLDGDDVDGLVPPAVAAWLDAHGPGVRSVWNG